MQFKTNKFKQALQASDKPLFGLWMGIPDTSVAEIGAGAGFDWLLVDAEHGPFDLRTIMAHLQAIEPYQVPALVRPVEGSTALIKQLMDIGVQTLLVPMVESARQAEEIVKAAKYPPLGKRGLGTSLSRAANWNRIPNYLIRANDEICVVVQIETLEGLKNIDEIVSVEGVDAIFIGPSDLSAAVGHIGHPEHPEVVDTIEKAFSVIINAGKHAGVLAVNQELVSRYIQSGARFIGVGVDTALLVKATQELAATYLESSETNEIAGY